MKNSVSRGGYATQAHFANVERPAIERSVFDRSAGYKTAFDAGWLIPFFVDEVLPGDTMRLSTNALARLATPIFPYMDNVYMDFHFFFVPNRLVWDNWEKFNGSQEDPDDTTDYLVPQLDDATWASGFIENSPFDYMGLPTKVTNIVQADMPNALVFRGMNLIWNEWYRDQNLQDSLPVDKTDGPDTTSYTLLKRNRRKDYFTSALPWPQKGPDVLLPLGQSAPIVGFGKQTGVYNVTTAQVYETGNPVLQSYAHAKSVDGTTSDSTFYVEGSAATGGLPMIYADLTEATASTINEIREAFQIQRLFERDARGGTRYVEILLSHFGVVSPDFRLQRPEFLGGGTLNVNVSPIPQTSASNGTDSPQGNLAAYAVALGNVGFNHSFVEHGHVIGFVSVRAETTYQQGLNRMWSRRTRFDFYWPALAHLGEQTIPNKEIYMASSTSQNNAVFGYQERWAEYRYRPSIVTGAFRSNYTGSLDSWHLALDFVALPTLASIIPENPPIDRIIAVPSEPQFIFDSWTKIKHARPMPTYSTPGLVDHF